MLIALHHAIILIAGTLGIATGAGLLAIPEKMLREHTLLRRWLFDADFFATLNHYQPIERLLYRHHRAIGAAVVLGALAGFMPLLWLYDHPSATEALTRTLGFWGARAVILSGWALAFFTLAVSLLLLIRPSAIKGFESVANRWIEPFPPSRNSTALASRGINRLILRAPRLTGLLLLAAGIACLLAYSIP